MSEVGVAEAAAIDDVLATERELTDATELSENTDDRLCVLATDSDDTDATLELESASPPSSI